MVIPPLDCSSMKAGEWLLKASGASLRKAGVPDKYLKQVMLNLQRFRIKCATVNAQCLMKCCLKQKQYQREPNKPPLKKSAADEERMWRMRDLVAHDVMNTEETYNNQLRILSDVLFNPLLLKAKTKTPVLSEEEIRLIFSDISVILSISTDFLKDLRECFDKWDNKTSRLGQVFKKFIQFFRAYADYVRNYDKAISFLATLPKDCKLFTFFKDHVTDNPAVNCNLSLSALLVVPVQRIPRYPLLLKDVIKYTPESHPDYATLKEALTGISEIADWVNECIRTNQSQRVCMTLQKELVGFDEPIMAASRLFVKEGEVVELSETEKPRRRVLLLFNDILIIADPKYDGPFFASTTAPPPTDTGDGTVQLLGGDFGTIHGTKKVKARFQFVCSKRLTEIELEDEPPFSAEFSACFALRTKRNGEKIIYAAENVGVRDEWKSVLNDNITQQVDLENKKNELREKAALPKAEQVKAMLGAQYFSLTNPLTAGSRRKTRDAVWRTLPAEEKEKVANDAREYVKMVEEESKKPRSNTLTAQSSAPQFGTFSMVHMKTVRNQSMEGKAESLRIRSRSETRRASILSESDSSIAFGEQSEMSTVDDLSDGEPRKEKKEPEKKHHRHHHERSRTKSKADLSSKT